VNVPAASFKEVEHRYFVEFLKRNPVAATYLGGDAYAPELAATAGALRDYSATALGEEQRFYTGILSQLEAIPAGSLTTDESVDAVVMKAQIKFMLRQTAARNHQRRCLPTYMTEPFRGIDWQIQGMSDQGHGRYGTQQEWRRVVERVSRVPAYLKIAETNLRVGITADDVPDPRMLKQDGLKTSAANAEYFEKTLPDLARRYTEGSPWAADLLTDLSSTGAAAARGERDFSRFILEVFFEPGGENPKLKKEYRRDRFAFGEEEYNWALANNLRQDRTASDLYMMSAGVVAETQHLLMEVARRVAGEKGWSLEWGGPQQNRSSTRQVLSRLGEEHPSSDSQMIDWYRKRAFELVEYGRRHGLFDIPKQYNLEVTPTPPVLQQSIDGAAYYPAPPFKKSGVGRFYVSPTGDDEAHLRENNKASMADLCAHEGFPGHDWHYQFLRSRIGRIGKVRWLTPGAVEDSSSMWVDSMMTEGWGLYSEQLIAEPRPGAPDGAYTPAERIYQLQGQLLRDARVRIDTGIHTGRMSFDEAVDYYTENVDFLPGACARSLTDPEARASCETASRALLRYSKWPTQAITYFLGKQSILDLRLDVEKIQGSRFDLKAFHEKVLETGTIPLAYVREHILAWARSAQDKGGSTR